MKNFYSPYFSEHQKMTFKDEIFQIPDKFNSVIFDVTDYKSIVESKPKVKDIIKTNGSYLCSIINNSGIALGGPVRYLDIEVFKKQFDVNYFGLISVTKIFLDLLIESNSHPLKNKIKAPR